MSYLHSTPCCDCIKTASTWLRLSGRALFYRPLLCDVSNLTLECFMTLTHVNLVTVFNYRIYQIKSNHATNYWLYISEDIFEQAYFGLGFVWGNPEVLWNCRSWFAWNIDHHWTLSHFNNKTVGNQLQWNLKHGWENTKCLFTKNIMTYVRKNSYYMQREHTFGTASAYR